MKPTVFAEHALLEKEHWWFVGRRQVLFPVIEKCMAQDPSALIMDIGCGTGGTVAHLPKNYRSIGIDESEIAVGAAHSLYPAADIRLGEIPRDLQPFAPQAQLYLLMDVLEHIANDFAFLKSVVEVARPNSQILITVPAHQVLWSEHDKTAGHFRRYEKPQLQALWSKLNVRERLCTYYNSRLYPLVRAIRLKNSIFGKAEGSTDFFMPNPVANHILSKIFGGESTHIFRQIDNPTRAGYSKGVSLVALLEKLAD